MTYHVTRPSCSYLGVLQVFYLPLNITFFLFYWVNLLVALLCEIWVWGFSEQFFNLQLSLRCAIWNSFFFIFFDPFGIILCSLLCFLFLYIYIYIYIYIIFPLFNSLFTGIELLPGSFLNTLVTYLFNNGYNLTLTLFFIVLYLQLVFHFELFFCRFWLI